MGRIKSKNLDEAKEIISKRFSNFGFKSSYLKYDELISNKNLYTNTDQYIDNYEDIIYDPYFGLVLNEQLEIIVDGKIYKITDDGTYITDETNIDKLLEVVENIEDYSPVNTNDPNLTEVFAGIYLYDTYSTEHSYQTEYIIVNDYNYTDYNLSYAQPKQIPQHVYNELETFKYNDARTWFGNIFQNLFGRPKHNYFDSEKRVTINFYSVNWIVYSAVGVNVKLSRKGWLGWTKTDADLIVLEAGCNNI